MDISVYYSASCPLTLLQGSFVRSLSVDTQPVTLLQIERTSTKMDAKLADILGVRTSTEAATGGVQDLLPRRLECGCRFEEPLPINPAAEPRPRGGQTTEEVAKGFSTFLELGVNKATAASAPPAGAGTFLERPGAQEEEQAFEPWREHHTHFVTDCNSLLHPSASLMIILPRAALSAPLSLLLCCLPLSRVIAPYWGWMCFSILSSFFCFCSPFPPALAAVRMTWYFFVYC